MDNAIEAGILFGAYFLGSEFHFRDEGVGLTLSYHLAENHPQKHMKHGI